MVRRTALAFGAVFLVGSMLGIGLFTVEEPPHSEVEVVVLEPTRTKDFSGPMQPQTPDQGELVNGLVRGPSREKGYRCVVLLQPIEPGQQTSKASDPVCSDGPIDTVDGVPLASTYLIARFYDWTNYLFLLVEYFGPSACSPTTSYGVVDLPNNLDNRFASGRTYSNCDRLYVYDFNYYGGAWYSCGANCPSFYALNDDVSSWRTTD